jgi:hypothetical protein
VLADARRATTAISCSGRSMRPAISQPKPTDTAAATARAEKARPVRPWRSCETTWSCTVRMKAATVSRPPVGEGMRL